ncbi:MAG: thiol protease/hemagglutinin PrtT [Bacteroidales bacterium]|nr:thiol protease/hemagglutinin PrtT [Bacteroidales bacterium]
MKRFFSTFILAAALMGMTANAGNVDRQQARQLGAYYLSAQLGTKSVTPESLTLVYEIANPQLSIPALYVFNLDQSGFVVVAGNEITDPIIAHSTSGSFNPNNIPPAFQWWLNQYVQTIAYAQLTAAEPDAAVKAAWTELQEERLPYFGTAKAVTILLKSKWDQGDPYNRECPMKGNQHCLTGCVATAMAQIMHYWRYPFTAKGQAPDPMNSSNMVNFEEGYYDQSIMPDELTTSCSSAQIHAVALLNYHCGVAARMSYDTAGSGSNSDRYVPMAFKNNFKYQSSLVLLDRNASYWNNSTGTPNYKDTMWMDTCKKEILAKRPIFYTGYDKSSTGTHAGHAFVCDGYNSVNKNLHFNWGWGGSSDCWCNVITARLNAGGYQFQSNHNALIGLTPPADTVARWSSINEAKDESEALAPAYPNPATEEVNIPCRYEQGGSNLLQIYDAAGRMVSQQQVMPYTVKVTVRVAGYAKGLYTYRLNGTARKFIVQ